MATLYPRGSVWWVAFIGPTGERVQQSTKLKVGCPAETRRAKIYQEEMTRREDESRKVGGDAWHLWVPGLFKQRYRNSATTLARYTTTWNGIMIYFRENKVFTPRHLTRSLVREFLEWRQRGCKEAGMYPCSMNTALYDLKVMRLVMNEAVGCGYSEINPCLKLGVSRDPSAEKPEITWEEHQTIMRELRREPEWMRVAYRISWYQGARLRSTCMPLKQVNLEANEITFHSKGKTHRTSLAPPLRPMFRRLIESGRKRTYEMPGMPSKVWWRFFKRIKMRHLCFHCTRVSAVSRCYRSGMSREEAMRFIGHSSTTVHKVYQRLHVQTDLRPLMERYGASMSLAPRADAVDRP